MAKVGSTLRQAISLLGSKSYIRCHDLRPFGSSMVLPPLRSITLPMSVTSTREDRVWSGPCRGKASARSLKK